MTGTIQYILVAKGRDKLVMYENGVLLVDMTFEKHGYRCTQAWAGDLSIL